MKPDEAAAPAAASPANGDETETVAEVLRDAARTLAGLDTPRLTAEALLAHLLGVARARLLSRPEQPLPPNLAKRFEALVQRAARGEPLAYLTGRREFYGLEFEVDARVLVPRPETELLVDRALKFAAEREAGRLRVADVGTGSGCIAITLAAHLPKADVIALDVSAAALELAGRNAAKHNVSDRVAFLHSELLSGLLGQPAGIDLLCANLPYIPSGEVPHLPVSQHEPALALDGGPDGLDPARRLLADAPRVMAPGGRLFLEIGAGQGPAAAAIARAAFSRARVAVHPDLAGFDRILEIAL